MPIYGVDIHPEYQRGINIEAIRAEGFDFLAAKASEGTNASYMAAGSADWIRRAKACGLIPILYHYLRPGDEAAQASVFAAQLARARVPGMLDAEALAHDGLTPSLTLAGIRRFLDACTRLGARVSLLYLPRWYWDRLGRPSLAGLPPLWASSYVGGTGPASELYEAVTPSRWADYGGGRVEVLQFTDRATVAGRAIDANHYRGTRAELAALLGTTPTPGELDMPAGVIAPGKQVTKLVMPIGPSISQLVARGWLSLASSENGKGHVWIQGPNGGIDDHDVSLPKDRRWYRELPDGTDQMTIHTDSPGPVGWCLELEPR